jgi:hypothetical protein
VAGAFFVIAWEELAVAFGHLDDCLAIVCAVAGVWAWVVPRAGPGVRAALAGTAIGLAAAAKPWAFVFLPVIALPLAPWPDWRTTLPGQARAGQSRAGQSRAGLPSAGLPSAGQPRAWPERLRAVGVAAACVLAVTLAAWLPFFAADPATTNALHYQIANMPDSALRALGVGAAMTPSWDRAVQIVLGCALGLVAIVRRRWAAVILLGAGARIALDPGVHKYYTPEVMAGALLWELAGQRRTWPVWTVLGYLTLDLGPVLIKNNTALGDIRLGVVAAFTVAVLAGPARWYWRPAPDGHTPGPDQSGLDQPGPDQPGPDQQCGPVVPETG